jgi:hypothetical protein
MVPSHAAILDLDAIIPLPTVSSSRDWPQSSAGGSSEPPLPFAARNFRRSRIQSNESGSAALVVLRSVAFHRRDLWIVKLLRSTSEGVSSVLNNLTKSLDLLLENR